ncbi:MAG TPA: hemerythrin domain-containing protein [Alphaproteobacteria bacterium]|nr:hemerythrin domain-containing protein [Alphaproteobacteria bacterium]
MAQHSFPDAIALLKADHKKVLDLFEQFRHTRSPERKQALAHQICNELKIHTLIEEEIFYPALRGAADDDILDEAQIEHDNAKVLVNDLEEAEPGDGYFDAKISVLCEEIKHHIREEEKPSEGTFAQARKSEVDLKELRDQMMERKKALLEQAESSGLPPAMARVVNIDASVGRAAAAE